MEENKTKKLNIYEKMLAITSELERVKKNLEVGFGSSKYKAVSEADVLEAVKPLESQYGIYSYPCSRKILEVSELETKSGGKNLFLRIETTYKFVNVENPEETLEIVSYGDGVDSQDKAPGKAMTYSDKYALMKAYKITTGDDPDQSASEELKRKGKGTNSTDSSVSKTKLLTAEQLEILRRQDEKLIKYFLSKCNVARLEELSETNANFLITKLTEGGKLQ